MQVLWPIVPEVDLRYFKWDCLYVYSEYRIMNLKWDFFVYWNDKGWYDNNRGFQIFKIYNIFPKNAFIKFRDGDKK